MFSDHRLNQFSSPVAALPDEPRLKPDELKRHFDASPEELRQKHNALCDALQGVSAAVQLGFIRTAGIPADNVQGALESVQKQVSDAATGELPAGSISMDKLGQDVRSWIGDTPEKTQQLWSRTASLEQTAGALQNRDNQLQAAINANTRIAVGTYAGNATGYGSVVQHIALPFTPRAVLVLYCSSRYSPCCALAGVPWMHGNEVGLVCTENGFDAIGDGKSSGQNDSMLSYVYLAFA